MFPEFSGFPTDEPPFPIKDSHEASWIQKNESWLRIKEKKT